MSRRAALVQPNDTLQRTRRPALLLDFSPALAASPLRFGVSQTANPLIRDDRRIALQLEHSIEVEVSLEFAWRYRTDIATWNDPPATFVLEGPFIAGSRGTTLLPEQQPLHWNIREVQPLNAFILEMQLDRALLTFEWRFDSWSKQRTRMTQRIELSGDNEAAYAQQVEAGFRPGLADGMRRIATEMAAAETRSMKAG